MKLYVARHGIAVPMEINMECPLSDAGRAEIQHLAEYLGPQGVLVTHVFHSGKLRARQTAEILAIAIARGQDIRAIPGLNPNDPTTPMVKEINGWADDTLLVGHLPFMDKLVSELVTGNPHDVLIDFQPGTLVCLQRDDNWQWQIIWVLRPNELS